MKKTFMKWRLSFLAAGALTLLAPPVQAASVWIEGENPSTHTAEELLEVGFRAGPMAAPDLQSNRAVLSSTLSYEEAVEKFGEDGVTIGYTFAVPEDGEYDVWARIGFETSRSPFQWRRDGGDWQTIGKFDWTIDVQELSIWNHLGWLRLEQGVALKAGEHTLEFHHEPALITDDDGKEKKAKTLHMLDAIYLTTEEFQPNGGHQPGADYQSEEDKQAAQKAYELPEAAAGERSEVELTGLWQIARWDEYGDDMQWNEGDIPVETQWVGVEELPEDYEERFWYSVPVPLPMLSAKGETGGYAGKAGGNTGKPANMTSSHRVIYRTRVEVPAEMEGRGFSLDFEQFNMIASVFVNGQFVEWNKNHDAPWEVDITPYVKAGETNDIAVVIKTHYYAVNRNRHKDAGEHGLRAVFHLPANLFTNSGIGSTVDFPVSAPKSDGDVQGISDRVKFIAAGGKPYVEDVFAKPSVSEKKLALEITLENPEEQDVEVELRNSIVPWSREGDWKSADPEKVMDAKTVTAKAGERGTFELESAWENPTLWWPDDPNLYMIKTEVVRDGKVVDTKWTRFGFREWGWEDGVLYTVNGKPWQFWNDLKKEQLKTPQTLVETSEESGRNSKRFWGKMHRGWGGMTKREILEYFDETGIVVRDTGAFDGQVFNYARGLTANDDGSKGYNKRLFQNVLDQQKAWVRGYRNHASILVWTMENEVAFVSAANAGQMPQYSPAIRYVGGKLMELDPTRPVMIDGGDALTDPAEWSGEGEWVEPAREMGYLPINGGHYTEDGYGVTASDFPDSFYTAEHWYNNANSRGGWKMVRNQPIHHGEIFYGRGWSVDKLAEIGGEVVYRSDADTYPVRSLIARMMNEGYRFNDVSSGWAIFDGDLTTDHQKAWSPIILLAREWNWTFGGGQEVDRKLRIINQTSKPRKLTGTWELQVDGEKVAGDSKTFDLDIGGREYWETSLRAPEVSEITEGQYILTVTEDGEEHFRDEKPVRILPWNGVAKSETERDAYVIDRSGELKQRLDERGISYKEVSSVEEVPEGANVLLVGRNSIAEEQVDDPAWQFLANSGARIVVFEQLENPLRGRALPAVMETTDQGGKIVHPQNSTHPVMEGLTGADFFCWSGDHKNYAKSYLKPDAGAMPILQAGAALGFTPLVEARTENDGFMILNQTLALTKMGEDPTARRLTDQLINYAFDYEPLHREMVEAIPEDSYVAKMLADAGIKTTYKQDPLEAMQAAPGGVVLVNGSKENMDRLSSNQDAVKEFRQSGGWLVLFEVGPEEIEPFNKLVGVDHLIRPATREAFAVVLPRPEAATGVNMNDVVMTTGKKIAWWKGTEFRSHDAYTHVVDYRDVIPFATINGTPPRQSANDMPELRNVANGLSGDEFWRYLAYFEAGQNPRIVLELPREETLDNFEIALATGDTVVNKFTLDFHDGGEVLEYDAAPVSSAQGFEFEPRTTDKVTFTITDYDINDRDVIGISTIKMLAERPEEFLEKVQPLTDPAALVTYPDGDGGTLLMNINYKPVEENPRNVAKKRNLTKALLSNLGVGFAGGASVVVGDEALEFEPIVLPESAFNIFPRHKDTGAGKNAWFRAGGPLRDEDIASLPGGEQRMDGVLFDLNDFAMADVPTIIALGGQGSPVDTRKIEGVQVNRKADALFFLHTYHPGRRAERVDNDLNKARTRGEINELVNYNYPTVLEYVVHYADGTEAVVPVRYRQEIGPWIDENLPETNAYSRVAWQAASGRGEAYLSVYSMQWNNPEPGKEIETITIRLPEGTQNLEQYGAPAVFAISAASVK